MTRKLYFAIQTRLHRDGQGRVRTDFGYARYDAWKAYLAGVDEVIIVSRVGPDARESGELVEGDGVSVLAVPYFRGLVDFVRRRAAIRKVLDGTLKDRVALYGARVPNLLGFMLQRRAKKLRATFVAQVVGDMEDVLRAGAAGRLGRWMAPIARRVVAAHVARADGVIYVTRETLQKKYPAKAGVPTLVRSNVELSEQNVAEAPRNYTLAPISKPLRLFAAGSQEQHYKGHRSLIKAARILQDRGISVELTLAGGGRFHQDYRDFAKSLELEVPVVFTGNLAGAHLVREHISETDIFVMPSLTEGLPRVLIEAMALGVFSIGSNVGGIPELLDDDVMFAPGDAAAIATSIERALADPTFMTEIAEEQWLTARRIANEFSGETILGEFLQRWGSNPQDVEQEHL